MTLLVILKILWHLLQIVCGGGVSMLLHSWVTITDECNSVNAKIIILKIVMKHKKSK